MAKHTATYEGVTFTRNSDRTYTHALFVLETADRECARFQRQADREAQRAEEYVTKAATIRATGVVPQEMRWFENQTPEAVAAQYDMYAAQCRESVEGYLAAIPARRAEGDRWLFLSMHQSLPSAIKAQSAAISRFDERVVVVEVERKLTKKEQAALAC